MIEGIEELQAMLFQFGSWLDMVDALRLQAEETRDTALFDHLTKGPFALLAERSAEIHTCLQMAPSFLTSSRQLYEDVQLFTCLADALLAVYHWSQERNAFALYAQSAMGLTLNLRTVIAEIAAISSQREAACR